jgi:hypothetical protein
MNLSRDQSWVSYATASRTMWVTSRAEIDQVVWPSRHSPKRVITVFFNGTGQYMLNILPECILEEGVIGGMETSCYPGGRIPHVNTVSSP